jgi:putative DNA primase/helicase
MPLIPPPAAQGEVTMMTYEEWEELEKATSPDGPPPLETYPESADGEPDQAAPPPLPVIQIKNGELSSLATRAEEMLIAAGVPIYQRGGALVRPIIETVDATRGRKTNICQLKILDTVYARDLLGRHAVWEKWDARARRDVPVNPPGDIAATMLARAGDWMFPVITGVISAPTMRPDGSLLLDPGYDAATRLLLVEPPAMPAIADHPTRQDAEAALKLIEGLLTGFPFVDDVARTVALSAIMSPVVRGAFTVAPLHASRAPTAGSGKSFLWDIVAAIAIGQFMPVMSAGASEEETEKRLGAALMAGQPLISIDNISAELGGDALCQIIERPVVDIRILGRSECVRIEAGGTSLFATGNNFTIVGDVCRRVITANLDPATERPELRQFAFDPIELVMADRGKYIAAALTICRAYFVAGRPDRAPRLASFEGWSDTVRSALMWLGKDDPVKSMEDTRAEDPERIELSDMLEAWAAVIGAGPETRMKLAAVLTKGLSMSREHAVADLEPTYPDFHAALFAMAQRNANRTGKSGPPNARMFGKWLQRFKGRIVNGKRFANLCDSKHGNEWWIEQV